jgi:hypothetical protein
VPIISPNIIELCIIRPFGPRTCARLQILRGTTLTV